MSDRERVEALAKVLDEHILHASMNVCLCRDWRAVPNAGSLPEQHRTHVAESLTDSPAMRDLLAEAKADALRDLRSAIQRIAEEWECEPLSNRLDDMVHARTCPNCHRADYLRALLAANPYRETGQADD